MAEFLIELTEQEVDIVIGLHDFEKTQTQRVIISVQIVTTDLSGRSDDFMNYDLVAERIRALSGRRIETQEDLVLDLHSYISGLPGVARARVQSRKPDVYADAAWVGLSYPAAPLF